MEDYILKTNALTKNYGSLPALNSISINVERGKIIGLLGPNGSGKTTLIKLIAGLLTPTFGEILIDGMPPSEKTKAIVSYLPERPYFDSGMSVEKCIAYFSDFYFDFDADLAKNMLRDINIDLRSKIKTLSKGTKEKLQLVLVMARRAKLYLLDEPIAGVDPSAREYILNTIISNYNKDAAIIISTHLIADVEDFIDRAIFINDGRMILDKNISDIKAETGKTLDEYFREVFKCSRSY